MFLPVMMSQFEDSRMQQYSRTWEFCTFNYFYGKRIYL